MVPGYLRSHCGSRYECARNFARHCAFSFGLIAPGRTYVGADLATATNSQVEIPALVVNCLKRIRQGPRVLSLHVLRLSLIFVLSVF